MKTISEKVYRMVTRHGFVSVYWEELVKKRKEDKDASAEAVFDELNGIFEAEFGEPRFPSYDAFRMYRNRQWKVRK